MTDNTLRKQQWLARWTGEPYLYLTTTGRRTGRPHRIEIWFAAREGQLYLLAGGRERSDWVHNLQATPQVTVKLGDETRVGAARVLQADTAEDHLARELLVTKYARPANTLEGWKQRSLPVAIEFPADEGEAQSGSDEQDGV